MSDDAPDEDISTVALPLADRERLVNALRGVRREMIQQRARPKVADTDRQRQIDSWERVIRDALGKLEAAPVELGR